MSLKKSGILTIAGLSFVGFCAVSVAADRLDVGPMASEVAGFCGALLGGIAAQRRARREAKRLKRKVSGEYVPAMKVPPSAEAGNPVREPEAVEHIE